jgi:hypothetical protein
MSTTDTLVLLVAIITLYALAKLLRKLDRNTSVESTPENLTRTYGKYHNNRQN